MVFQFTIYAQYYGERSQVDVEPASVEHLWYQAAVGQRDLVADAILPGAGRQEPFDGAEAPVYPVLGPFVLLFLSDVDQDNEVLERLDARCYDFADLTNLREI